MPKGHSNIFVRLFCCKNSCVVRLYAYFYASKANKNPAQFGHLFKVSEKQSFLMIGVFLFSPWSAWRYWSFFFIVFMCFMVKNIPFAEYLPVRASCSFVHLFCCKNSCIVRLYAYFCASKANKNPAQFGHLFISPPLNKQPILRSRCIRFEKSHLIYCLLLSLKK